jgi:hypothetical protein
MTNLLPASIEQRAIELIQNGFEPLEAVKRAIENENRMIDSLFGGSNYLTHRGKIANEYASDKFWNRINKVA